MNQLTVRALFRPVVCVLVFTTQISLVLSFSIATSSSSASQSKHTNQLNNVRSTSAYKDMTTTLPPLLSTLAQDNRLDDSASLSLSKDQKLAEQMHLHLQQHQQQQQDQFHANHDEVSKQTRSSVDEHDESVPLATINNHSRNNQQPIRPPQYVDVAALVGVSFECESKLSS